MLSPMFLKLILLPVLYAWFEREHDSEAQLAHATLTPQQEQPDYRERHAEKTLP